MGLYVMKEHEKELLAMNFEQILNFITEKPKLILSECCNQVTGENLIYSLLKKSSKGKPDLSFLLQRLEQEFNNSLAAA